MVEREMPRELTGIIRQLRPSEEGRFRDHLLRLDRTSRRDRFNGATSDAFVESYAHRCFQTGAAVIGYVEGGQVLGAAELHERLDFDPPTAEIAFSVEEALQHQGIGSLLFERLVAHAYALGYSRLYVTTHSQNAAMKALARKFDARLTFQHGETMGMIELPAEAADSYRLATPFLFPHQTRGPKATSAPR